MQYPEQLLRARERDREREREGEGEGGARLLEKFDTAFGPLKENGMSLLNGATSESEQRGESRTGSGRSERQRTAPGSGGR